MQAEYSPETAFQKVNVLACVEELFRRKALTDVWLWAPSFVFPQLNIITVACASLHYPTLFFFMSFFFPLTSLFPTLSHVLNLSLCIKSILCSWFFHCFVFSPFSTEKLDASFYPSLHIISPSPPSTLIGSCGVQAEWPASVAHDPLWPWQLVISMVTDGWGVTVPCS